MSRAMSPEHLQNNGLILQKRLHSLKEQMNRKKGKQLISVLANK
jgi:hypothetical protein